MSEWFDPEGNPISMEQWAEMLEQDVSIRRIGFDELESATVSTVWLGLNHQWGDGPPLIFETMVFGGPLDGEMDRYATREQAAAGHHAMLARVRRLQEVAS